VSTLESQLQEALGELVSAVKDGLRRANAGDPNAIHSSMIQATMRQAEALLASRASQGGEQIVDVGAFRCPEWFAEAMLVMIELAARDKGLKAGKDADKNTDAWLSKYAPGRK
jgi:hypothetical protein